MFFSVPASAADSERIINGKDAKLGNLPHQVSLSFSETVTFAKKGRHFCGGSLIVDNDRESWVLTAAHCVSWYDQNTGKHIRDLNPKDLIVLSGTVLLEDNDRLEQKVSKVIFHKDYDPDTSENDIALLKLEPLSRAQKESKRVVYRRPINFVPNNAEMMELTKPYTGVTVSGWGRTETGSPSSNLKKLERLPIVDNATCDNSYSSIGLNVTGSMLCAGLRSGGYDSCQGDSGGPLSAISRLDGQPVLIGVVSWGYRCAEYMFYGVYTRVAAYMPWIQEKTL